MKSIKLFCIPYAGGSATIYNKWRINLNKNIELFPVELAGRGRRINEDLYDSIDDAVEDVFNKIENELNGCSYSFFGHSMGGLIIHELAKKCIDKGYSEPVHLFFSGRGAPHIQSADEKNYHRMPEEEFQKEILELGGTPKEFFKHPELLELMLPVLKNDFKIVETREPCDINIRFKCNITVFLGKEEKVSAEQMFGWKDITKKKCSIHYFNGAHFFIHNETENIINVINTTLNQCTIEGMIRE